MSLRIISIFRLSKKFLLDQIKVPVLCCPSRIAVSLKTLVSSPLTIYLIAFFYAFVTSLNIADINK